VSFIVRAARAFAAEIATLSAELGRRVTIDAAAVLDRSDVIDLQPPGLWSPNRSCRLLRAADGWIAVNLPRESDFELVPAWIGGGFDDEPWGAIAAAARKRPRRALVEDARLLGLAVAGVGEIVAPGPDAPLRRMAAGRPRPPGAPLKAVDLSSLWAGPLCGALLAEAGLAVTKLESRGRPDTGRNTPAFFRRMNAAKAEAALDFDSPDDRARLADAIAGADAVITGARPRAFEQLGLTPEAMFARNPGLIWVAITGYGWTDAPDRVAFGDDSAAAGGLVRWTPRGEPRFLGDALADPLTGLAAAVGALRALKAGGGLLVDAAMARTAAGVVGQAALAGAS
jgi:hypothetical protein